VLHILQEGSAPDVWLQLPLRCVADPAGQLTALRSLAQQLSKRMALAAQQQEQLSDQQQLIAAQQQQIAGLQEQLSAQQRASAEQMAGLQAQLRQLHAAVT
jgi:septal ring factor EnvC (AmiA/AmiB activator)